MDPIRIEQLALDLINDLHYNPIDARDEGGIAKEPAETYCSRLYPVSELTEKCLMPPSEMPWLRGLYQIPHYRLALLITAKLQTYEIKQTPEAIVWTGAKRILEFWKNVAQCKFKEETSHYEFREKTTRYYIDKEDLKIFLKRQNLPLPEKTFPCEPRARITPEELIAQGQLAGKSNAEIVQLMIDAEWIGDEKLSNKKIGNLMPHPIGPPPTDDAAIKRGQRLRKQKLRH